MSFVRIQAENVQTAASSSISGSEKFQPKSFKTPHLLQDQPKSKFTLDSEVQKLRPKTGLSEEDQIQSKVQEVLSQIREEVMKSAHEEGYQAGLLKGLNDGHEQAQKEAKEQFEEAHSKLLSLISSLDSVRGDVVQAQENYLFECLLKMTQLIVKRELISDPAFLKRSIIEALENYPTKESVKISLSPKDFERIQELKSELKEKFPEIKSFQFESSPQLEPQNCLVETDTLKMDVSLQVQLENLESALKTRSI